MSKHKFPSGKRLIFRTDEEIEEKVRGRIYTLVESVKRYYGSKKLMVNANTEGDYITLIPLGKKGIREIIFKAKNKPETRNVLEARYEEEYFEIKDKTTSVTYLFYRQDVSSGG